MKLLQKVPIMLLVIISSWVFIVPGSAQTDGLTISINQIPVGEDYAYSQRGYFWDFSDTSHYALEMTREHLFDGGSISGGWLSGRVNSAIPGPAIWLLTPSDTGSNITQYEGAYKPIDPSRYRYLTMRICIEDSNVYGAILWYPNRYEYGISSAFPMKSGCQLISIDLSTSYDGIGVRWNSGRMIEGISLTFLKPNTAFSLDYVRLSDSDPGINPSIDISWPSFNGTFSLFFDSELDNSKKTLISSGLSGESGKYSWKNVPDLAPNSYHFILEFDNTVINSKNFIVNSPPSISIFSPSFTSGPDYATDVIGDPWDMDNSSDIASALNIVNLRFVNGTLAGTSTSNNRDPILYLNGPKEFPVNTRSYFYFTYRMRDLQSQDIAGGSVARIFWKHQNMSVVSTTEDIITFDGWKTVTIDLREAILEPGSISWSTQFVDELRFDPNEFNYPRNFEIDDIKLTGNDIAKDQYKINFLILDPNNDIFTTSVSYSTNPIDQIPSPISCNSTTSPGTPPKSLYTLYLPIIQNGEPACVWNTSNVPAGTYYIFVTASDGFDSITRISETPVEVHH